VRAGSQLALLGDNLPSESERESPFTLLAHLDAAEIRNSLGAREVVFGRLLNQHFV
jgi:hypothetical protein